MQIQENGELIADGVPLGVLFDKSIPSLLSFFASKPKNLYPNMKLSVFKNSRIAIMVPTALNTESKIENPLVLHGFRPVVTILGVFNYFQI